MRSGSFSSTFSRYKLGLDLMASSNSVNTFWAFCLASLPAFLNCSVRDAERVCDTSANAMLAATAANSTVKTNAAAFGLLE
jgi:hypothetical protein